MTTQTAEVGTLLLSLLFNKGPTFPDLLSRKYGRPSPDALWGWGLGAEENKQNEESCLRICFGFVLPKSNSCCRPLHNFSLQWQNTGKFAELHSSQCNNKWINWRQTLKELFANGHHARVTHAMLPAEFLSWVQKIQIDAPPKRVYINLHFIH